MAKMKYKTSIKEAFQDTLETYFGAVATGHELKDLKVSLDYPNLRQEVPMIWIGFQETDLSPAGFDDIELSHYATIDPVTFEVTRIPADTDITRWARWVYEGRVTVSMVALSSVDRDEISDAFVEAVMHANIKGSNGLDYIFDNQVATPEAIAEGGPASVPMAEINWKGLKPAGEGNAPTSWGDDLQIYESTYTIPCYGEIISTPETISGQIETVVKYPLLWNTTATADGVEDPGVDGNGDWK